MSAQGRDGMTLREFAQANPVVRGRPCWVCTIPEREAIDAERQGPLPYPVSVSQIVDFLVNVKGYDPTEATGPRINNHFTRRHHIKPRRKGSR